jgi:hypothetical protein
VFPIITADAKVAIKLTTNESELAAKAIPRSSLLLSEIQFLAYKAFFGIANDDLTEAQDRLNP